jgi:hypothetical protein
MPQVVTQRHAILLNRTPPHGQNNSAESTFLAQRERFPRFLVNALTEK